MKKMLLIILLLSFPAICFSQELVTEFTEQDKRGVAFAKEDAIKAIESGNIYIISGGYGNEPIVEKQDIEIIKGLPIKSIGCMGDFEYARKFNNTIIHYLKDQKDQPNWLSKENILTIAISKAEEVGYKTEEMEVIYDEENRELKKHFKRTGISEYDEETSEWKPISSTTPEKEYPELIGRNYQAVYLGPKELILGGDLWVLIDKNTGEVITCIRGK